VRLKGRNPQREKPKHPLYTFASFYDLSIPAEEIVDVWDYDLSCTKFMGDAFPHVWPNFGPGVLAALLGASLQNGVDTVWFQPTGDLKIEDISLSFVEDNTWFKRIKDIFYACVRRWGDAVQVGMTDLGGNLDVVASFLPSGKLPYELYDNPFQVERLVWETNTIWWRYFEVFNEILQPHQRGYSCWTPIYSDEPYYMLQCDFSYMISPLMFEQFVMPELVASSDRLRNPFYHLDGIGQLPHLDSIKTIDSLKGIQWVPGDGQPDVAYWGDVYKPILQAGKLTQIFSFQCKQNNEFELLDILLKQTGCVDNVVYMLELDLKDQKRAEKLLMKYCVE
jgi:5-methyltetrahydrofolate--homocysteine methyltransferase